MASKSGGGGRKVGRGMRKPAHNRYTMERRWETNKKKKAAKQARQEKKAKERRFKCSK